ncbi:cytochrome c oxidase subunit 6b-1 [Neltuma alba]|uniref:cytochrome c oxidase subunit 6b-1 n=1 Tax=Neltuma alba TaxID=207710 RepID=UPI0010A31CFC|nr:cytochrome c oxidase subunit 6b-1-like [Prosopis alba]
MVRRLRSNTCLAHILVLSRPFHPFPLQPLFQGHPAPPSIPTSLFLQLLFPELTTPMAVAETDNSPTLAEQYLVNDKEEKKDGGNKPVEVKQVENPREASSEESVAENNVKISPAPAKESSEVVPGAEESAEPNSAVSEESNDVTAEQTSGNTGEENSGDQDAAEETPEIKLETAPADFRFPTTNQTRHCFTRYVEYHRCIAAKGEGAPECDKFAKYYRSLCPGEWVDRWNEQRESGTFPGPL